MEEIQYRIEGFEGPLDLLLHLIARHKMQLYDINIYELIDQYLEVIGFIGQEQLDPTSEFIEMAARLVYMKSAALLPRHEEADELERELTGQLIEYHLCKQAAQRLRDMSEGIDFFVRDPLEIPLSGEYTMSHEARILLEAYLAVMGRGSSRKEPDVDAFDPLVSAPIVAVSSRIVFILRGLRKGTLRKISDLFYHSASRSESVATFLGVLELIKAQRLHLDDEGTLSLADSKRENGVSN